MQNSDKFIVINNLSNKLTSLFRKYAQRRIHDGFKQNKNLNDPSAIKTEYMGAQKNLEVIKRQVD